MKVGASGLASETRNKIGTYQCFIAFPGQYTLCSGELKFQDDRPACTAVACGVYRVFKSYQLKKELLRPLKAQQGYLLCRDA